MPSVQMKDASIGLFVVLPDQLPGDKIMIPLQVRGTHNADGNPQSMVGAVQSAAHVKLLGSELADLRGPGVKDGDFTAIVRGLLKETSPEAGQILGDVLSAMWEAAGIDEISTVINAKGRRVRIVAADLSTGSLPGLSDSSLQLLNGSPYLTAREFHRLVAPYANPTSEVAEFKMWDGSEALTPLTDADKDKANSGQRVIPVGELRGFDDDIAAAQEVFRLASARFARNLAIRG